ncbi:MAG: lipase family protein [Chitinophaga sp.]|uniref:lipase family protein n=1 Tax=Chitinophaga sp. TaxID=1869181 RepID=UPI001B21081A|nr:lipase family protein [Chitinophaga sp.]MBO9729374.1 lipase family protein [Chitinophaga sp.]
MEPQVASAAISYSEATTIGGFVAIAAGLNKKGKKKDFNPSLQDYQDIVSDPDYKLLLDPDFLDKYTVKYNIQVPENDNGSDVWSYFGFIASHNTSGDYVIAIRGTQNGFEASRDDDFFPVPFHEYNNQGLVPQGFRIIFETAQVISLPGAANPKKVMLNKFAADLVKNLNLTGKQRITVTGHSLGAAVATYFAAVATLSLKKALNLCLYTFASPKAGDKKFVSLLNDSLAESIRIYNAEDKVPNLPVWNGPQNDSYVHVTGGIGIDSTKDPNVNHEDTTKEGLGCAHQLPVYMYLLAKIGGDNNPGIISAGNDRRCRALIK